MSISHAWWPAYALFGQTQRESIIVENRIIFRGHLSNLTFLPPTPAPSSPLPPPPGLPLCPRRSHIILGRSSTDATVTLSSPTASRVHALVNQPLRCRLVCLPVLRPSNVLLRNRIRAAKRPHSAPPDSCRTTPRCCKWADSPATFHQRLRRESSSLTPSHRLA